jgi:16S rRNA (uracil1498-N3)-methyltransferase
MPRFYCPGTLSAGSLFDLPAGAARHVQVLRMQPGQTVTLFNGQGGEDEAVIEQIGRSDVRVRVGVHNPVEREAQRLVHLAVGIPANERFEWLVEKATELGVASIQPLTAQRSVVKVSGERTDRKLAHWQAVAASACEQCGRNHVPIIQVTRPLLDWLSGDLALQGPIAMPAPSQRFVLTLRDGARPLRDLVGANVPVHLLSGPEGGLSSAEEDAAINAGFIPASLGPRILRAETAPLAALAVLLA